MAIMTYSKALALGMSEEMRKDKNVMLMGLDIGYYGGAFGATQGVIEEFGPERVMCMPIAEAGYMGAGVGAAMTGLRPVIELEFGDWVTIASDQLVNQAANFRYMTAGNVKVPLVLRLPCGGFGSAAAQHSHMFEAWFAHIPGLKVISPSTPSDAKGLIKAAIRDNNPVVFTEHRLCYQMKGEVPEDPEFVLPIGKADVKRQGKDITIVTYSYMVHFALEAAQQLQQEGIDVEVIDLMTIRPMDKQTIIESVKKTNKIICLQETYPTCGVVAEVAAVVAEEAFDYLDAPVKRVAGLECPVPFSPVLEAVALPDVEKIKKAVREFFQ